MEESVCLIRENPVHLLFMKHEMHAAFLFPQQQTCVFMHLGFFHGTDDVSTYVCFVACMKKIINRREIVKMIERYRDIGRPDLTSPLQGNPPSTPVRENG